MNIEQVRDYVTRYLKATQSQFLEQHPAYVTVKLSPEADQALMNRHYYWSFVERTGVEPETMSITFVFDQEQFDSLQASREQHQAANAAAEKSAVNSPLAAGESILARYFGTSPASSLNRTRHEPVTFGSGRLQQLFSSAKSKGAFVHMYEQPPADHPLGPAQPARYISYLGVNYKVEYVCDIKRDELHSLGICLSTGEIVDDFHRKIEQLLVSPKLPAHTHINDMLSLPRAVMDLERYLERHIQAQDHGWASRAEERMNDELHRIGQYYQEMIQNSKDEDELQSIQTEYRAKQDEIAWQFKPRVLVSAISCGIFHLFRPLMPLAGSRNLLKS